MTEQPVASAPAARPRRRMPLWVKRAGFESMLIVFSLVLAFAINEWRESRVIAERVAEARELVIAELEFNRKTLQAPDYLPHHESLLSRYQELARTDAPGDPVFETGVHPAPLRHSAWQVLSTPDVFGRIPYSQTVILADLYQEQQRLEQMHWTAVSWLIAPQAAASDPVYQRSRRQSTSLYLADIVSTERRLLEQYQRAIEILSAPTP